MRIRDEIERAGAASAEELLPLLYDELRRLARARLARKAPGQTLQPTALVHEAYLRLVGDEDPGWNGRGHFFGAAAPAMRRILVEQARRKGRARHGGGQERVDLADADSAGILAGFLVLSVALSILAGYVTATISRHRVLGHVVALAALQLAVGILVQMQYWDVMPIWYHLIFLALLVPGVLVGARIKMRRDAA